MDEFANDVQQVIAGLLEASVNHSTVHRTAVKMKDQVRTVYLSNTRHAVDYVLLCVCLCVINFCQQNVSETNLWIFAKLIIADTPYIQR